MRRAGSAGPSRRVRRGPPVAVNAEPVVQLLSQPEQPEPPFVEYGDAINSLALERAVTLAREHLAKNPSSPTEAAAEAVALAYCVCVTTGEDAAERRLSDVHRELIEIVVERLEAMPAIPAGTGVS
ncbi:MAG TPA: hypothetical protein VFO69_02305 [Allosphingosinicella sp.]|nr:hypothetical protein [Allosphingosinicella sp.]